jgi:hypothetical protein
MSVRKVMKSLNTYSDWSLEKLPLKSGRGPVNSLSERSKIAKLSFKKGPTTEKFMFPIKRLRLMFLQENICQDKLTLCPSITLLKGKSSKSVPETIPALENCSETIPLSAFKSSNLLQGCGKIKFHMIQ